jgi:chromosome partitioning protein
VPVIAIVNRKGGSGKSTLATHVAAWLAHSGEQVMLGDVDRQQSAVPWLKRRQTQAVGGVPLVGWALDGTKVLRPPSGVSHVVLDTPGGLRGFELSRLLMYADVVLMPVCDSIFDRESAAACLKEMRMHPRAAVGKVQIGVVGMRVDARTRGEPRLRAWAAEQGVTFAGALREARSYVRCAEHGLTIFDLPPAKVQGDLAQWEPIVDWLGQALESESTRSVSGPMRLTRSVLAAAAAHKLQPTVAPISEPPEMSLSSEISSEVPSELSSEISTPPSEGALMSEPPLSAPPHPLVLAAEAAGRAAQMAPAADAGPATVFPGDLMRPLVPVKTPMSARLRRLWQRIVPQPLLARVRH